MLFAGAAAIAVSGTLCYGILYSGLLQNFGCITPEAGSQLAACLDLYSTKESCAANAMRGKVISPGNISEGHTLWS